MSDVMVAVIVGGFNHRHPGAEQRHWSEDFPHENGVYENICAQCKGHFLGHKRRVVCKVCASEQKTEKAQTLTPKEAFEKHILSDYGEEIVSIIVHFQKQLRAPLDQSGESLEVKDQLGNPVMTLVAQYKGAWHRPFIVQSRGKLPFVIESDLIRPVLEDEEHLLEPEIRIEYRHTKNLIDTIVSEFRRWQTTAENAMVDTTPILYIDKALAANEHALRLLKDSLLPVKVIGEVGELVTELKTRGLTEKDIQEKLTGITHDMRSDAELPRLAEVVRAMPAWKVNNPGKSSRRPTLPKNRKRDRWN